MLAANDFASVFEWCYQHLALVGYTAVCIAAWRGRGLYADITQIASKMVGQIDSMATNHFPHMEESLKNQDKLLGSVDESLKTIVKGNVGMTPRRRRATPRKSRKK